MDRLQSQPRISSLNLAINTIGLVQKLGLIREAWKLSRQIEENFEKHSEELKRRVLGLRP